MKRSLSLILAILLTLSCLVVGASVTASAETPEGTGINDLSALNGSSGTFYLTENITVSESVASFSGTLDGNGKTITTSVPVFAALSDATIKNLTIAGTIDYTGTAQWGGCGALVSNVNGNLTLNNVTNTAAVTMNAHVGHDAAGGLVGYVTTGALTLADCTNSGAVTGNTDANKQTAVGGLIGYVVGSGSVTVTGCKNTATLTGNSGNNNMMGGIIGLYNRSVAYTFENCTNEGTITSPKGGKLGGLVGVNSGVYAHNFEHCENKGSVSALTTLAGYFGGFVADESGILTLTDCTNSGNIEVQSGSNGSVNAGGLVGFFRNGNSNTSTFADCKNTGNISSETTNTTNLLGGFIGNVTTSSPLLFRNCVNEGNVTESATENAGRKGGGFIGYVKLGTTFEKCLNKGRVQMGIYAGGFIGQTDNTVSIEESLNLGAIGSSNTKAVDTNYVYAGGFIGLGPNTGINIEKSANYGAVTASAGSGSTVYAGGILGRSNGSTDNAIIDVANYGAITADAKAGGIIGHAGAIPMTRCANFGVVSAATKNALNGHTGSGATDCYGTTAPDGTYQGANAAATCFGLNFGGGTWILREGYPELAFVETVLGSKEKSADPTVVYKGVQQTAVSDGKFAIRVVEGVVVPDLVNNNPFQYVGMEIIFAKAGDAAVKGANRYSRYVYSSILAGTDGNGVPAAWGGSVETDAGWVEGTYYSALTVTGIPAEGTYTVIVRPYTTSAEGEHTKSYGDAYAFLCTDGVIVANSTYLFAAPARAN